MAESVARVNGIHPLSTAIICPKCMWIENEQLGTGCAQKGCPLKAETKGDRPHG